MLKVATRPTNIDCTKYRIKWGSIMSSSVPNTYSARRFPCIGPNQKIKKTQVARQHTHSNKELRAYFTALLRSEPS